MFFLYKRIFQSYHLVIALFFPFHVSFVGYYFCLNCCRFFDSLYVFFFSNFFAIQIECCVQYPIRKINAELDELVEHLRPNVADAFVSSSLDELEFFLYICFFLPFKVSHLNVSFARKGFNFRATLLKLKINF